MKQVVWRAVCKDGKIINEFDENGNYFDFRDLDKDNLIYFSLTNKSNNSMYMINLLNGELLLGGTPVNLSLQCNFRNEIVLTNQNIHYGKYLFWYNESFADFTGAPTSESYLQNVFMGYEIPLEIPHKLDDFEGVITGSKLLVSINVNNNKMYLSQTTNFKTCINGKEVIFKI